MGRRRVPEIRFDGFDDEYKLKTIGDLTRKYQILNEHNLRLESYSISSKFGFIKQKELYKRGGRTSVADKSKCIIILPSSFSYDPTGMQRKAIGYYENKSPCLVSSMYVSFKTNDNCYDYWLWYWIRTDIIQSDIKKHKQGGVRERLYYSFLKDFDIIIPSISEQQKISQLIKTIDNKIDKSQKNLKYIEEFRNELLNKMIVQERER